MTDSFGNDILRIMRSKTSTDYPRMDYEYNLAERDYEANHNLRIVDRIQVQFSEGQHAFLLRHPTRYHWCGYIHTSELAWTAYKAEVETRLDSPSITYAFPGFEPVCWMVRNANGFLKKPVDIDPRGDFFVGFELSGETRELAVNDDYALELLKRVHETFQLIYASVSI